MDTAKRLLPLPTTGALLFFLAFIIFIPAISAQSSTKNLRGIVTDESDAIIPEAKLILRDEKERTRETVSGADGSFSFGELPFGKYRLTIIKEGFTTAERTINLDAASQNSDLVLTPGSVSESVTIVLDSAEAAVESTLKTAVSIHETPRSLTVVGEERMRDQNFRQVSDVLTYVPGMTPNSYRTGSYHF
jgi:hemoglobin/transferrin/lactoferrin receptor protein